MKDITKKQLKALELTFNSGIVQGMGAEEYKNHLLNVLTLTLQTARATHGDQFMSEFVNAAFAAPIEFEVKQVKPH